MIKIVSTIKKTIFLVSLLTVASISLTADPGYFDIYKINFKGKSYYFSSNSIGILKHDLCYYDIYDNYQGEVKTYLDKIFSGYENGVELYLNFDKVNVKKIAYSGYGDDCIYNFYNAVKVKPNELIGYYQLEDAYNVVSGMYTDPFNQLRNRDQNRINQGIYHEVIIIPGLEAFEYFVYAEKTKYSNSEVHKLRKELMMARKNDDDFFSYLMKLFDEGVIILCICYE